ncbi:MAG TPA: hypothetical protein VGP13_00355 [Candidatus Paceibacterota bacterium]|jgi:hypothetical protein|nr:hypothetical protein [Candidatus Paceibacterota bacterium]
MRLKAAPYLWICPSCGGTAKVVFPDGTNTRQFITKHFGLELIDGLHKDGRIDEHERKYLRQAVSESRLAPMQKLAEQVFQAQQDRARQQEPAPSGHVACDFMQQEIPRTASGDPIH